MVICSNIDQVQYQVLLHTTVSVGSLFFQFHVLFGATAQIKIEDAFCALFERSFFIYFSSIFQLFSVKNASNFHRVYRRFVKDPALWRHRDIQHQKAGFQRIFPIFK